MLAYDTHELSETFPKVGAIELIQTNIYLHLKQHLSDWYYQNKTE